jgi:electron transport complex protein RnfB
MKNQPTPEEIDKLLPQTQCGLCGYPGCMPYAEALSTEKAAINLCPPGGVDGLLKLASLLKKDPTPFITEMRNHEKPASYALIREAECIGCMKCLQACPVDAILGSAKLMHTVLKDECTGCELCLPPCPVDCIEIIKLPEQSVLNRSNQFRNRFASRNVRLQKEKIESARQSSTKKQKQLDKKSYIQAALLRVKEKKAQQNS